MARSLKIFPYGRRDEDRRRQCKQTTCLGRILAPSRQTTKIVGAEIRPQGIGARHGGASRDHQLEARQPRFGESPS
jgi:hypothetical protein